MSSPSSPLLSSWGARVWTLACLAWLILTWAWGGLHLAMTVDDTFYYFKTALNVSRGLGSTFDGLNPTNGYHPLWLALLSAVFSLFRDDLVFLTRVAFTIQVVMVWAGGMVLARVRAAGGPWVLLPLTLALLNPFTAKIVLCGQETALQFLTSSAALVYWWNLRTSPTQSAPGRPDRATSARGWIVLGLLCTLATLSRLDTIFFCAVLLAMPVVLPSETEGSLGFGGRLRLSVIGGAAMTVGLAPYLVFNVLEYKHMMPVSGAIKLHLETSELSPMPARAAVGVLSVICLFWLWSAARRRALPPPAPASVDLAFLAPPLGAALVASIYNFAIRGEMSPSLVRIWYLEPYLLALAVAVGAILQKQLLRGVPIRAITRGAVALWVVFAAFTWRYRVEPRSYGIYAAAARCSEWFDHNSAPGAVAAAWDAGFAAAMTRKPVMNLDGLISSWEFKENYLDRGDVDEFISKRHPVDYVIQYAWPATLRNMARRAAAGGSAPPAHMTSGRWGVDLSSFYVAHVECVMVSVATNPKETIGPVQYFVLSRAPAGDRAPLTLAEFAMRNAGRESCD
jgi:hypothetical protein